MRTTTLVLSLLLSACLAPDDGCIDVSSSALRGGGWDLNGRALGGGGGWDYNGRTLGEGLEAIEIVDAVSGRPLRVVAGAIDAETVVLRGATSGVSTRVDLALVRVDEGVPLYDARVDGSPLCDGLAMLAPGSWSARGDHAATAGVTIACEHGAIAKCALWGYAPWNVGDAEHVACTRMVRADYCGDGTSWTRDGTPIDVTDVDGIQTLAGGPGMSFEAGWTEHGAACVRTTRYEVLGAHDETLLPSCWASLPRCDEAEAAFDAGALVASHVLHETAHACR
jgi:hypothetical protein